jgi:hypothetical protein
MFFGESMTNGRFRRFAITYGLIVAGATGWAPFNTLLLAQDTPAAQASDALKIIVIEGEDGVNIVKKKVPSRAPLLFSRFHPAAPAVFLPMARAH